MKKSTVALSVVTLVLAAILIGLFGWNIISGRFAAMITVPSYWAALGSACIISCIGVLVSVRRL